MVSLKPAPEDTVHPYVATLMVNEIASDRAHAARHARSTRRRERRQTIRRAIAGR
jgi:hypothetical protein